MPDPLQTPDGRYIVVDGKLWRATNPALPETERKHHVAELMNARRAVRESKRHGDDAAERKARDRVDAAKHALGERGEPWWSDGEPDYSRCKVENTPYANWYRSLSGGADSR